MENTELRHAGTKGMKWGKRLYQNKDGSLTPLGRIRYGAEQKKRKQQRSEALEKARQAKTEKANLEAEKQRILNSHSAKEVYENKHLFTDKEIQDAYLRLNNERNIKNLIPEEVSAGKKFINSYADMSKNIKTVVDSSTDLYKSYQNGRNLVKAILGTTKGA